VTTPEHRPLIAFLGTGRMGFPMVSNLLRAGFPVRVWNRTEEKARPLTGLGAVLGSSPRDAVQECGVAVTMLADDDAVRSVAEGEHGFLGHLGEAGVHVSMSTIAPATARELSAAHAERGERLVSAPVFGRPDMAERAMLVVCAAGEAGARERVRSVLAALGQRVADFGDRPEAANVVKLAGNFLIAAAIESMAEAYALAEKNGVDRARLNDLLTETLFACPVYQGYGRKVADEDFEPALFGLPLGLKDVSLVLRTAAESEVPMPLADLLEERLTSALAKGRAELDWSGLALEAAEAAGLRRG